MFKKSFFAISAILAITVFALATGFYTQALTFYNSNVYSTTTKNMVAATGKDTTQVFQLSKDEKRGYADDFTSELTFQIIGEESVTTDSLAIQVILDLSMDGTNWVQHGILDTLRSLNEDTGATVTDFYEVTTHKNARYGRLRLNAKGASGDTVTAQVYMSKLY